MRAIRLPYPLQPPAPNRTLFGTHALAPWELMRNAGMMIDFPHRRVSYVMFFFNKTDLPRYAAQLRKAVELQSPGQEPPQLEIRISG